MSKPNTVAVTLVEGGGWITWFEWQSFVRRDLVHAIKFADGSIWDARNGWRDQPASAIDGTGWAEAAFPPRKLFGEKAA